MTDTDTTSTLAAKLDREREREERKQEQGRSGIADFTGVDPTLINLTSTGNGDLLDPFVFPDLIGDAFTAFGHVGEGIGDALGAAAEATGDLIGGLFDGF